MRIFRLWVAQDFRFEHGGQTYAGRCFGGSNLSEADAARDAKARWQAVVGRITGTARRRDEDYVADIREEVLRELNPGNLVTRNRYGAEVLNSADHLFLDIDAPPRTWRDLFGGPKDPDSRRARIVEHVRKASGSGALAGAGVRMYQTPRGVRLLVTGIEHSPRSAPNRKLMGALHVDRLYQRLCGRQDCYRARLTPKPSGIGLRTPRCVYPRDEATERAIREWVGAYDLKRQGFAACKLLETVGPFAGTAVSEFHDQRCRVNENLPLA